MKRRRGWSDITVTDQFCGAGGISIGAAQAGLGVRMAMNHWALAIETHNTNFPDTDHDCCDISASDPRRYPSTDILITSPECTTHSPAGGNRRAKPQRDLFIPAPDNPATARSRATMWDVPRFAEFHQYRRIIVENVVEAYTQWPLFSTWLQAMHVLGYRHRIVSANSMFSWPTPQSRDRIYINFWKKGDKAPDLEFRPKAPCGNCGRVVEAVQTWKPGALKRAAGAHPVGKYRFQYTYSCPECRATVTPFYFAGLNAIDLSIAAERIGDRPPGKELKPRTLERIRYGMEKFGRRHLLVRTIHGERLFCRVRDAESSPFDTQPGSAVTGLFSPFIAPIQGRPDRARCLADELPTQVAECPHDALISPSMLLHMHADGLGERVRDARTEPLATQTARQDFGFVFNVAGRDASAPLDRPMPTQETREKFAVALVNPAFIAVLRTNNRAAALDDPMATVCTGGGHHLLISGAAQLSMRDANAMRVAGVDREMMAQGCGPQAALIQNAPFIATVAYSEQARGSQARGLDNPIANVTGSDRDALIEPTSELRVEDCYFRMLQPHEIGRAMAFDDSYVVLGNKRDRVKQYGNAVTPPVMTGLIERQVQAMTGERVA